MKILIPEKILPGPLERLRAAHDVHYDATLIDRRADLVRIACDADCIIVRNRTQVRDELLDAMTRCKVIGRLGVGLDNIDVAACNARSIIVVPAVGANARSVAEYVVTTALMLMRGAYLASADVAAGKWPNQALKQGREIHGMRLGVAGFGSIGRITGKLAHDMGMRVVAYDSKADRRNRPAWDFNCELVTLERLLEISDVVSIHMPRTPETLGLFDARRIGMMKSDAVLINTARGGIVDEQALADALRRGCLRGAALDVFDNEPLGPASALADAPNLLLTPHIAGVTVDSEIRVCDMVTDKVLELLEQ
ncbi:MAG: D-3-phosphoglycerate dehydrogenase 1 [Herminiimonas sp.]|nr:D-3-phosphoglycerate dehydrogenase 1 [Herminiimonas sp.]